MNLLLHDKSLSLYNLYIKQTPHALMLVAPMGSGKRSILDNLAKDVLGKGNYSNIVTVEPLEGKNTVGIEQIRDLKAISKLKSANQKFIIIPDAGLLSIESQNSMLKLLEEPPIGTHILLSVNNINEVITTIQSRVNIWCLDLPTKKQINEYYSNKFPEAKLQKAILLSDGRMGLLNSILNSEESHELVQAIDTVKEILAEKPYERLCRVDSIVKDPKWMQVLLEAMMLACRAAMEQSASTNSVQKTKAWLNRLNYIVEAQDDININVSAKLVLGKLFLMI